MQKNEGGIMNTDIEISPAESRDFLQIKQLYHLSVRANSEGFIQDLSHHGCIIKQLRQWRQRAMLESW
jgi:hypothetical protein